MLFANTTVDASTLPLAEEVQFTPPQAKYLTVLRIEWAITAVVVLLIAAALIFFIDALHTPTFIIAIIIFLFFVFAISWWLVHKSFNYRGYALRQHDVAVQHGWLLHHKQFVPFNRVQNCSISIGPLERRYGLAALRLFTAAADGADLRIAGLTQTDAENLRAFILKQIDATA